MEWNDHRDFVYDKIHEYHHLYRNLEPEKVRRYLAENYNVLLYLDAMERRIDEYRKTDYYREG